MPELRISVRNRFGEEVCRTVLVEVIPEAARPPESPRLSYAPRRIRLGQILVEAGLITQEQLRQALDEQRTTGERIGHVIRGMGLASPEGIAAALAQQQDIEFIRINQLTSDEAVLSHVSETLARRYQVIPVRVENRTLVLGMVDPLDLIAIDDLRRLTGMDIEPAIIISDDFQRAIAQYPTLDGTLSDMIGEIETRAGPDDAEPTERLRAVAQEAPVIRLANLVILQAVRQGASDIHVEPQERLLRVRYRVDGVLSGVMTPPKHVHAALVSRLKIMASINIAERRVPQDGRIQLKVDNRDITLRVSTVPTTWGEKVVMRILDKESTLVGVERLGLQPTDRQRFDRIIAKPHGIVLLTGPTGSGKTTSLYAILNRLNKPDVNIITIEDPVEYQVPGISQVQVNPKAGLTFAGGLRSFLRQDPDIIMVGEIRDEETGRIAIQAALTGHLVLSTLHTNDAPSAVTRLVDMGIESFLVASSTIGVIAQRLVRVLCEKCREPYTPARELLDRLGFPYTAEPPTFYRPKGCQFCHQSGYKGRVGIFEVMAVDGALRDLIAKNASSTQIRDVAVTMGMRVLQEDGLAKVAAGVTSLEEVFRVAFVEDKTPRREAHGDRDGQDPRVLESVHAGRA